MGSAPLFTALGESGRCAGHLLPSAREAVDVNLHLAEKLVLPVGVVVGEVLTPRLFELAGSVPI